MPKDWPNRRSAHNKVDIKPKAIWEKLVYGKPDIVDFGDEVVKLNGNAARKRIYEGKA